MERLSLFSLLFFVNVSLCVGAMVSRVFFNKILKTIFLKALDDSHEMWNQCWVLNQDGFGVYVGLLLVRLLCWWVDTVCLGYFFSEITRWFLYLSFFLGLKGIFILNITFFRPPEITVMGETVRVDTWVRVVSWMLVFSSLVTIPIFAFVTFCSTRGSFKDVWWISQIFWSSLLIIMNTLFLISLEIESLIHTRCTTHLLRFSHASEQPQNNRKRWNRKPRRKWWNWRDWRIKKCKKSLTKRTRSLRCDWNKTVLL